MNFVTPDWRTPPRVRALTTLRIGGASHAPYDSLNLAAHVGDDPERVLENRRRLFSHLNLPDEPFWLEQMHGTQVLRVSDDESSRQADGAITSEPGKICAVLTADCLPVLFASTDGSRVGAAHAGWRGLAAGVLEATMAALATPPRNLLAWLGPAISQEHFEVGPEVRAAFLRIDPAAATAFVANSRGRWQADLYRLARQRLNRAGIDAIYGGDRCTFGEREAFFSHRRDQRCGRMASLIWMGN
jgi:YfiH family protein